MEHTFDTSRYNIRPATVADVPAMVELYYQSFYVSHTSGQCHPPTCILHMRSHSSVAWSTTERNCSRAPHIGSLSFSLLRRGIGDKASGSALLQWGCEEADKEGLQVYLDASPMGSPLYTKHFGFVKRAEVPMPEEADFNYGSYIRPVKKA